jgi:hypothetical protein
MAAIENTITISAILATVALRTIERSGGSRSEHQCSWIGVLKGSRVPERKRLEASRIQVLACRLLVRLRELPRNEKQIAMPAT